MPFDTEQRADSSLGVWVTSGVLVCGVLVTWVSPEFTAPINTDAGFYVPHALHVLQGEIPYQDFPSGYAPGIY